VHLDSHLTITVALEKELAHASVQATQRLAPCITTEVVEGGLEPSGEVKNRSQLRHLMHGVLAHAAVDRLEHVRYCGHCHLVHAVNHERARVDREAVRIRTEIDSDRRAQAHHRRGA